MNRYRSYMNRIPQNLEAEYKALNIPNGDRARRKRALGLPRLIAVAAAFALLLGGGAMAWVLTGHGLPFIQNGPDVPNPIGEWPGATNRPGVLDTVFVPFTEYERIDCWQFWGIFNYSLFSDGEPQPLILQSQDELNAFMAAYDLRLGQGPNDAAFTWGQAVVVDFDRCAVIVVIDAAPEMTTLLAPVVIVEGDAVNIMSRKADDITKEKTDTFLRGYFLAIDRDLLGNRTVKKFWHMYQFDNSHYFDDITPDALRGIGTIYKDNGTYPRDHIKTDYRDTAYETYFVPSSESMVATQIGTGFGGFGVRNIQVTDDGKYLIYPYSFGSGISRSQFGVLSLETGLPVYESGPVFEGGELRFLQIKDETGWGVFPSSPDALSLANVFIQDGGILFEIRNEAGYSLAGLDAPNRVVPPSEPAPTALPGPTAVEPTPLPTTEPPTIAGYEIEGKVYDPGVAFYSVPFHDDYDSLTSVRTYQWVDSRSITDSYLGLSDNHMRFIGKFEECDIVELFGEAEWTKRIRAVVKIDAEYDDIKRNGVDYYTNYYILLYDEILSYQAIPYDGAAPIDVVDAYCIELRFATQLAGGGGGVWTQDEIEASIRTFRLLEPEETSATAIVSDELEHKILSGDLSDYAGDWVNGLGQKYTLLPDGTSGYEWTVDGVTYREKAHRFTKQGNGEFSSYMWQVYDENYQGGGHAVELFPIGVEVLSSGGTTDWTDLQIVPTDTTKARLYAGHSHFPIDEMADHIYYQVP